MRRSEFIWVWCVSFIVLLIFILVYSGRATVRIAPVFIVFHENSVEILTAGQTVNRFRESGEELRSSGHVNCNPAIKTGPINGLIEWWITESIFSDDSCIQPRKNTTFTQEQTDRAYAALLDYANTDPEMTKYRPGQPSQTRFSFALLGQTLLRLAALFGLPTIVAYVGKLIVDKQVSITHSKRRKSGLCIRCKYPCATIPSLKCPECGCFHTVPHQVSPDSDDQPPA